MSQSPPEARPGWASRVLSRLQRALGPRQLDAAELGFQNMMSQQAVAAVAISGAGRSQWNGTWYPSKDGNRGVATWTGEIGYDRLTVLRTLQHMWRHAGQQHDVATLQWYRAALQTVLHENAHMLSQAGEDRQWSIQPYQDPAVRAMEEGVTDEWARRNVNAYIQQLDLERIAPGISAVDLPGESYPTYTPAVSAFSDGLAQELTKNGHPSTGNDVMHWLNQESAALKFPAAASWLMETSGLNQQIPEADRAAAQARIESAMRAEFAKVPVRDPSQPMDQQSLDAMRLASINAGQSAVREAQATVNQLRAEYPLQPTPPSPEQQATAQRDGATLDTRPDLTREGTTDTVPDLRIDPNTTLELNTVDPAGPQNGPAADPQPTGRQTDGRQTGGPQTGGPQPTGQDPRVQWAQGNDPQPTGPQTGGRQAGEQQATGQDPRVQWAQGGPQAESGPGHFAQWRPPSEDRQPTGVTPDMRHAMTMMSSGVHRMDVIRSEDTQTAADQSQADPAHTGAHRGTVDRRQGPAPKPGRTGPGE